MNKITPVLLGADLNCYSVARAFHESYGVSSYVFGKCRLGETSFSKIIKFQKFENLHNPEVLCAVLENFASAHEGENLYLVPCTDEYASAIAESREILQKHYFFSCPPLALAKKLFLKEDFYNMCAEHGLPFPKTAFFYKSSPFSLLEALPFPYPIIIKPSSSIEYWRHPFEGMKKVYSAKNKTEAERIIATIFSEGYSESIVLQELVPSEEDDMYVLTTYSDRSGNVRAACMGRVLLGEHTPKGLGNHVAIITEYHEEIAEKIYTFLEEEGYRGFANLDIIFDRRDKSFKLLDLNLRQGRSNYYVTASGANVASLLVADRNGEFHGEKKICRESFFWHTVPKNIIYKYISNPETQKTVRALAKNGKSISSLFYADDIKFNPVRAAYVLVHNLRYYGKYNNYR